jgi:hypothetical protein
MNVNMQVLVGHSREGEVGQCCKEVYLFSFARKLNGAY